MARTLTRHEPPLGQSALPPVPRHAALHDPVRATKACAPLAVKVATSGKDSQSRCWAVRSTYSIRGTNLQYIVPIEAQKQLRTKRKQNDNIRWRIRDMCYERAVVDILADMGPRSCVERKPPSPIVSDRYIDSVPGGWGETCRSRWDSVSCFMFTACAASVSTMHGPTRTRTPTGRVHVDQRSKGESPRTCGFFDGI